MLALIFIGVFLLLGLGGYLIWAMQQKLEKVAQQVLELSSKVRSGEDVIADNFEIVEKRFAKLDHEIKEGRNFRPNTKAAIKAARLQKAREQLQARSI